MDICYEPNFPCGQDRSEQAYARTTQRHGESHLLPLLFKVPVSWPEQGQQGPPTTPLVQTTEREAARL